MEQTYTKAQIRAAFDLWLKRCEGISLPDAKDPDELADYLVEIMEEPEPT